MNKLVALIIILSSAVALAQPVQVQVILRSPAPGALPVWASDPSIVQVILRNTTPTLYDGAVISFSIRRLPAGNVVARSKDFHPQQPRFTIPPNGTLVLSGPQIIHESAVKYEDELLRQKAQATGQLPEGEYEFCARLLDESGRELGSTGAICPRTVVMLPDPPMLIHPRNDSTLTPGTLPLFIWAPVTGSAVPVTYTLRVVPLFPGQAPQDALNLNAPVLNLSGLVAPLYQYVPTDIPFTAFPMAVGFVWQVSAVDQNGQPATRNNGKSEIFRFTFAPRAEERSPDLTDTTVTGRSTEFSTTPTTAQEVSPVESTPSIGRIALPHGFVLILAEAVSCTTDPCTISGYGSLYVPLLADSVRVRFSGITVRRTSAAGTATLVGGTITIPLGVSKQMGLLTLFLRQLRVTSTHVLLDGTWVAQWDRWGWACRTADSIVMSGAPLFPGGLPHIALPLTTPWTCDGNGLLIGECIRLWLDTLDIQVVVDTTQSPPIMTPTLAASGNVMLPCIMQGGMIADARIRLRLDRGPADLIAKTNIRLRQASVQGMPQLRFDADTLVLDLSESANPAQFPPPGFCSNPAWLDPRWRGIYIIGEAVQTIAEGTMAARVAAIFDQGRGNSLLVSLVGESHRADTLTVGGFRIQIDSLRVQLCQGILQRITAEGRLLPVGERLPHGIFDSVRIRLSAYDDGAGWRWNVVPILSGGSVALSVGPLMGISLHDPQFEQTLDSHGPRRGYLQFQSVRVHIPAANPGVYSELGSIRIWNTGEIEAEDGATGNPRILSPTLHQMVSPAVATALELRAPILLPSAANTDGSESLLLEVRNTGTQEIPIGTVFDLAIGVYIEHHRGERSYRVERQYFQLPQQIAPGGTFLYPYSIWMPRGGKILGVRVSVVPRPPLVESDGTANNTVSRGQLPPFGVDER